VTDFLGSRNVIYTSIMHGYRDITLQSFRDYNFELSKSRDVIGHVTTELAKCDILYEVYCDHTSILHGYGYINLQICWGHDLDLL